MKTFSKMIFTSLAVILFISCANKQQKITEVTVEEAAMLLESDDVTLIDVRSASQYEKKRLEEAINIDIEDDQFVQMLEKLDKDEPILIYCNQGVKSARCSQILSDRGFTKIYDIDGGLAKWESSGRKVIVKEIDE